jgi:hypothetical protein
VMAAAGSAPTARIRTSTARIDVLFMLPSLE